MNPDSITTQYHKEDEKWRIYLIIDKISYIGKLIDNLPFEIPIYPNLREENIYKCPQLPARNVPKRLQTSLRVDLKKTNWN